MRQFFNSLQKYRGYIFYSAKAQLKAELANSWLGGLWWVLEPTLNMLVYLFVFTVVFHRSTTYVVAFIILGLSYWRFFHNCVISSITLLKRYRSVIMKVYIPKCAFVCILMVVNGFKLLCAYIPIIGLMFYYSVPLSIHILTIVPITLLMLLLTFGICCWCMHIGVYIEDLSKVMTILLQMVFYISGVFYPINELLEPALANQIFALNPIAFIINEARNALLYAAPCQWNLVVIFSVIAVLLSVTGILLVNRGERQYIKVL